MNLDKTGSLFFGVKIDSKLRDALHNAKPGDRRYFEGDDDEFLRICEVGDTEKWIGKVLKVGMKATEVEDIQRNVVSILRRIASNVRISPSSVKIFAIAPEMPQSSGREPYIANY